MTNDNYNVHVVQLTLTLLSKGHESHVKRMRVSVYYIINAMSSVDLT